jgi:hypothetical protein
MEHPNSTARQGADKAPPREGGTPEYTPDLDERHLLELTEGSGITPEIVEGRGYITIRKEAEAAVLGFSTEQRKLVPALGIPMYAPDGAQTTWQIKPDTPRKDKKGKPRKYENPAGSECRLGAHPSQSGMMRDVGTPLWVTEGSKKADSLVSRGEAVIAVQGVWNWQRQKVLLPEWEQISLPGRLVYAAFDSDAMTNPQVGKALKRLVEYLKSRGATTKIVYLPSGDDGSKVGVDDFLVAGGTIEGLKALAEDGLRATGPGVLLSNVVPEKVEWLWPGRIPYGKVSIIDGDPGQGKSALTIDLCARITRGRDWPDGGGCDPGGAVICSAEDGLADTIRPRLDAAGGDPTKVLALATVPLPGDSERMIEIPADLDLLREAIRQVDARLLIIDPLMAFLPPEADAHKDQHVRRALSPLAKMAESTGCAVVVVRHLNKGGGAVLYRGGGSVGIIGAARSGMLVAPHPEDDDLRVLAPTKNNLAAHAPTLTFCMREASNGAVRVEWRGETTLTAEAALAGPTDHETRDLRRAVEDLIRDRGGEIEATPQELHDALAEHDLAALPDRPAELSKKLTELARTSTTGLTVTRGWRGKERVLRLGHR